MNSHQIARQTSRQSSPQIARRIAAFVQPAVSLALAAGVTLVMLGSIDHLATQPAPDALLAQLGAPASAPAHS